MAVILTSYYKPKPGGLCKRLFRAINALLDAGHEVHYLAVVPFPIEHPRCCFHRFPWPESRTDTLLFWGIFHLLAPLFVIFIGYRHKITHGFVFGHTYSLVMQPLRLVKHIPLALFLRGDSLKNHLIQGRLHLLYSLETLLEGLALSGVRLFCVSQTLEDEVRARHRVLKPRQTGVLRNHIHTIPTCRHDGRRSSYPLTLSCVGILERRKNQRLLLDVIEQIQAEEARLYLFGIGPQEEELRELVRQKDMEERIAFMGWREPEEIYHKTDLLLMPSLHEGAPNAVLEALERGIPVLANDIPEHREILPESSLLSPERPEEWALRINDILANPDSALSEIFVTQQPYTERLCFDWDERIVNIITDGYEAIS